MCAATSMVASIDHVVGNFKLHCQDHTDMCDLEKILKECERSLTIINNLKRETKKKMFKNHGKKWKDEHREHLMKLYTDGVSEKDMRGPLGRDTKGIEYEITKYLVNEQKTKNMSLEALAKKYKKDVSVLALSIDLGHKKR